MAPPDQEVSDFEPLDQNPVTQRQSSHPHDSGRPATSSRDIAKAAAQQAVRGEDSTTSAGGDQDAPLPSEEQQVTQFEDMEPVEQAVEQTDEDYEDYSEFEEDQPQQPDQTEQTQPRQPGTLTQEEYEQLQEQGINIPVAPDEVPEEFADTYTEMVQTVADTHHAAMEHVQDAREAVERVRDFANRLSSEEGQRRVIIGMALNNSEVFEEALNTVQRMQEDPEYRESVVRQLEAEAKYEAATRKERAMEAAQTEQKGMQVENRTVRQARRLGVNPDLAKEMVVKQILLNEAQTGQRDISLREVDQIVQNLAKQTGAKPRRRAKAPQTQKREQQANTQPAEGTGQSPPSQQSQQQQQTQRRPREPSRGPSSDAMDNLRNAVRQSAQRASKKGL